MLILLRFMETKGVALGYVGDKIRYIRLIRVRLTSEFFFRTRIYLIDTDISLLEVLSSRQQSLYVMEIPRLRPGLLSLRSVLASSQILLARFMVIINSRNGH